MINPLRWRGIFRGSTDFHSGTLKILPLSYWSELPSLSCCSWCFLSQNLAEGKIQKDPERSRITQKDPEKSRKAKMCKCELHEMLRDRSDRTTCSDSYRCGPAFTLGWQNQFWSSTLPGQWSNEDSLAMASTLNWTSQVNRWIIYYYLPTSGINHNLV